jgi:hypothetical protein
MHRSPRRAEEQPVPANDSISILDGSTFVVSDTHGTSRRAPTRFRASSGRQENLTDALASMYLDEMMAEPTDVVAQTASTDPEVGLRGVASLRALLEAVEELQVRRARELGWSWQQIAALLGVSKQAVHQKYGRDGHRRRRRLR